MKRLWLAFLLSTGIHASLFYMDAGWLRTQRPAGRIPDRITISLEALRPVASVRTETGPPVKAAKPQLKKTEVRKPALPPAPPKSVVTKKHEEEKEVYQEEAIPAKDSEKVTETNQTAESRADAIRDMPDEPLNPQQEGPDYPSLNTSVISGDYESGPESLIPARPMYLKNPPPHYPKRARRKGYEGTVILEVLVDERGSVDEIRVFKTSGYDLLDESAVSSVYKWAFEPGTRGGFVKKMWVRVPIRFKLTSK